MRPVGFDDLAEIALLIEKPYADQRYAQVACGFHLIAGYISQSARVDRKGLAESKFHAQVGDAAELRVAVRALKPCFTLEVLTLSSD